MARTAITPQNPALAGITPSYAAGDSANGMYVPNDGKTLLQVKNTGGAACTVTLKSNGYKVAGVALADQTVTVPATTGDKIIGPFDPMVFNQAGGTLSIDLSTATGVTIAAFKMP